MIRACTRWLPTLGLTVALFVGCGGSSKGGGTAGASSGGANTGGANAGSPGVSGGEAGSAANTGGASSGFGGGNAHPGGGTSSGGSSSAEECDEVKCGPQLGIPNWTCVDGSVGGPTGRCLLNPTGSCSWEINNCPRAGEGGASNQGGQGNVAGGSSGGSSGAAPCGVCAEGTTCVLQNGGPPGTNRFLCATQNPCGAAAACACIVGQGTCQPNRMGDPPGYCSCDNGLD